MVECQRLAAVYPGGPRPPCRGRPPTSSGVGYGRLALSVTLRLAPRLGWRFGGHFTFNGRNNSRRERPVAIGALLAGGVLAKQEER
jgi:hypothetical protein